MELKIDAECHALSARDNLPKFRPLRFHKCHRHIGLKSQVEEIYSVQMAKQNFVYCLLDPRGLTAYLIS